MYEAPNRNTEHVKTDTYCRVCDLSFTLWHIEINADKNALSPVNNDLDCCLSRMMGRMQHTSERHQGGR